jgi:hypothetical protein
MNTLTFILPLLLGPVLLGVVSIATLNSPGVSASAGACGLCMLVGGFFRGL